MIIEDALNFFPSFAMSQYLATEVSHVGGIQLPVTQLPAIKMEYVVIHVC